MAYISLYMPQDLHSNFFLGGKSNKKDLGFIQQTGCAICR